MEFDKIISLGASCQVAYQIRKNFSDQPESYPFDWFGTYNIKTLIMALEGDIKRIGLLSNLVIREDRESNGRYLKVKDTFFDISMMHQFPSSRELSASHSDFRGKFDYLCQRWSDLMASDARVLFIRMENKAPYDRTSEKELEEAIGNRYPSLNYTILNVYAKNKISSAFKISNKSIFGIVKKVIYGEAMTNHGKICFFQSERFHNFF